jgi:hypothetical protein
VLVEHCLFVGGTPPLLRVRTGEERPPTLRLVRSTLVGGQTLLAVRPAQPTDRHLALHVLAWDALLCRTGDRAGGDLVALPADAGLTNLGWQAYNSLYAGWQNLLSGPQTLTARDLTAWQRQWRRSEGDTALVATWPARPALEPEDGAAAGYRPTPEAPVGFAASAGPDQPLGCDLDGLPPTRAGWLALTYERYPAQPLEPFTDDRPPEIPNPGDGLYHGERRDLSQNPIDLGAYLESQRKTRGLGPKVVLHLSGTGDKLTTPITVKGTSLVLFFEPPRDDAAPLVLSLSPRAAVNGEALLAVEDGDLTVVGGELRLPDPGRVKMPPFLLKVRGGDLRLLRCRLQAPPAPDGYRGLVVVDGSGDPAADKARGCSVNECVLVSGQAGIVIRGVGARLLLRQSLLVAGTDALELDPGAGYKGRAGVQCLLDHGTLAAQRAAIRLHDVGWREVPHMPVLVQTRMCAFLNPFAGKPKAGLLLSEGEALARGLLVWQSEGDGYDTFLHFGAATTTAVPDKPQGHAAWARLLGSSGVQRAVPGVALAKRFDNNNRWPLERLVLPRTVGGPDRRLGADLARLGVLKKTKPR